MYTDYKKIDLHIHTPASACYKEDGDLDDIYFKIVETACNNKLEIIAITDHNTLSGYERIIQLKDKLYSEYEVIKKYNTKSYDMTSLLSELEAKKNNFDKLLILPGVEITVIPGIHLIIICNPDCVNVLKEYLNNKGYCDDLAGNDSIPNLKIEINQLLDDPALQECIILAPHVDSDKGIFHDLKGEYRASILRNENLMCLTCNNPIEQQKLINLFASDPTYKRKSGPAFVNASDAHSLCEIGSRYSLIKLETLDFNGVVRALKDPLLSIKSPEIKTDIEKIIEEDNYIFIEKYNEDTLSNLSKFLCAQLNKSGICNIILGASEKPQLNCFGIELNKEEMQKLIEDAAKLVFSYLNKLEFQFRFEELGNRRNIGIFTIRSTASNICFIKETDEVYIIENKKIKKASIIDIEKLVKQKYIESLKDFEKNKGFVLEKTINILNTIRNPISQFEIIEKISRVSFYSKDIFDMEYIKNTPYNLEFDTYFEQNHEQGKPYGNLYYLYGPFVPDNPHYEDIYLRCSCFCVSSNDIKLLQELPEFKGPKIILTKTGATFLAEGESWHIIHSPMDIVLFTLNSLAKQKLSIYAILGWLKSSPFIWYIYTKFNNINFFAPDILYNIPIPFIEIFAPNGIIEAKVKEIILLEKDFLHNTDILIGHENCLECLNNKRFSEKCNNNCNLNNHTDNHNNTVMKIAKESYQIFLRALCIKEKDINVISENITNDGVFNFIES